MSWFRDYPPAITGLRDWFRGMPEADLDDVIAELRTGVATLRLAEAVRDQRQLQAEIRQAVAETVPEVDADRFVDAFQAAVRARRKLDLPRDPLAPLEAAFEVVRNTPHPEEDQT